MEYKKKTSSPAQTFVWLAFLLGIGAWVYSLFDPQGVLDPKGVQPQQEGGKTVYHHNATTDNETGAEIRHLPISYLPPPTGHYSGPDRRKDDTPRWKKRTEITAVIAALALLAVNIFIAWGSWKAADAAGNSAAQAKRSADISTEALHSGQRAFIYGTFNQGRDGNFWRISVRWLNGGDTPTGNMIMHVSFGQPRHTPLPSNFAFPDLWNGYPQEVPTQVEIAAKGEQSGGEVRIVMQRQPFFYYIWGWARYHDVFPRTAEHVTRFCFEFGGSELPSDQINIHAVGTGACARYNCTDDACKE